MNKLIIGIIGIVVVGIIIFYAFRNPDESIAPSNTENSQTQAVQTPITPIESPVKENIVTYTADGFTPKEITIKVGETIKFINTSGQAMWVGVDEHPTHTQYDGTTLKEHCPDTLGAVFDQCKRGDEYSFTFKKIGKWDYHNHSKADMSGIVIVE